MKLGGRVGHGQGMNPLHYGVNVEPEMDSGILGMIFQHRKILHFLSFFLCISSKVPSIVQSCLNEYKIKHV